MPMNRTNRKRQADRREGIAAVEFALIAPLFVVLLMGVLETSRVMEAENLLSVAAREGARLGAMDRNGMLASGQSSNQKITNDVLSFLETSGISRDQVDVVISEVDDLTTTFDLDNPDNRLRLFQVTVQIPYSEVGSVGASLLEEYSIEGSIVFRNSRATIVR